MSRARTVLISTTVAAALGGALVFANWERLTSATPRGVGPLKLGMTVDEVQAIPSSGVVRLTAPLTPEPGGTDTQFFATRLATPWTPEPRPARLTFVQSRLQRIEIELGGGKAVSDMVVEQLEERYGKAATHDLSQVSSCYTKDGLNRHVPWGAVREVWDDRQRQTHYHAYVEHFQGSECLSMPARNRVKYRGTLVIYSEPRPASPF